jgi:hypothetical protein
MTAGSSDAERAAELYAQALAAHAQHDYWRAHDLCEQSLALREDDEVRELYRRIKATVGPA